MKLVVVNLAFAADLLGPDDLLTRYHSLVGWADALTQAGASVTVVQAFTHDEHRHRRGVDYIFCRTRRSSFLPDDGVRAAVQAAEPDVVHVNGLDAPMQAWWLRRALAPAAALVVQDHAGTPTRPGTLRASLRRRAMRAPDAFLFTTWEQAAPWLEGGFIREAWRVQTVLEASTTVEPIEPSRARAQVGLTGAPAIVWVGRLTPNKDPLVVLEGIERAAAVLPDLTCSMLFSDRTLLAAVQDRVDGSRVLRPRVRLVGEVPHGDIAAWLSAADVFVLGSHHEGSGYAAIEACACGAEPVLTDIPSFRFITGGGAIGAHWPPGDAVRLSEALVAASGASRARGRAVVRAHFDRQLSWTAVGARALEIYRHVLERRRSPQGH